MKNLNWDIYSNGDLLNTIVASDETAIARYCKMHGYTYKERRAPSESEIRFIVLENKNAENRDKLSALEAENKRLNAKLSAAIESNSMLEECLVEMAGVVYA